MAETAKSPKKKCKRCGKEFDAPWQLAQHAKLAHRVAIRKALARKVNGNGALTPTPEPETDHVIDRLDFPLGYATGRVEAQLEAYARSVGVAPHEFTTRVARLLQRASRGQVLGPAH